MYIMKEKPFYEPANILDDFFIGVLTQSSLIFFASIYVKDLRIDLRRLLDRSI